LDLSTGPLLRAVYFDWGEGVEGRLLLVIHHLAVDGVSWRILLEDLQRGYEQLRAGQALELAAKTTSYQRWAEELWQQAQSEAVAAEASYWLAQSWEQVQGLPRDYESGANLVRSARSVTVWLSAAETAALLREVAEAYHTQIQEVLLTGLVRAFNRWSGAGALLVEVEGHGREEEVVGGVDLSRTVGWFTSVYPKLLEGSAEESLATTLKRVKEQVRETPRRGLGYGMLRYLNERAELREQLQRLPRAEVSFNYLGQFDQVVDAESIFQGAEESAGANRNELTKLNYLIEINSSVNGGKLRIAVTYSDTVYKQATVEHLASLLVQALREIITHCSVSEEASFIPSDFPDADLSQVELEELMADLGR
jgi:non-ribosomal peptide synthase protein (TIGR01720 family)